MHPDAFQISLECIPNSLHLWDVWDTLVNPFFTHHQATLQNPQKTGAFYPVKNGSQNAGQTHNMQSFFSSITWPNSPFWNTKMTLHKHWAMTFQLTLTFVCKVFIELKISLGYSIHNAIFVFLLTATKWHNIIFSANVFHA